MGIIIYFIGMLFGYIIGQGPIEREWAAWLLIIFGAVVSLGIGEVLKDKSNK